MWKMRKEIRLPEEAFPEWRRKLSKETTSKLLAAHMGNTTPKIRYDIRPTVWKGIVYVALTILLIELGVQAWALLVVQK